jgi:hypothetical protein
LVLRHPARVLKTTFDATQASADSRRRESRGGKRKIGVPVVDLQFTQQTVADEQQDATGSMRGLVSRYLL